MTKQFYEMIDGQTGGAPEGGAAVAEGEVGSLLPGAKPARNGLLAACVGTVVAIALLVGCVAASPGASARDASGTQMFLFVRTVCVCYAHQEAGRQTH